VSDAVIDIAGGRIPLPTVRAGFGYEDDRSVKKLLDELQVPYVVIRRIRHYRLEDIQAALDRRETFAHARRRGRPRRS
jgi:hypothetical protein